MKCARLLHSKQLPYSALTWCSLFSSDEVQRILSDVSHLFQTLSSSTSPAESLAADGKDKKKCLSSLLKQRQSGRRHIEIPAHRLTLTTAALSNHPPPSRSSLSSSSSIPFSLSESIWMAYRRMNDALRQHLHDILQLVDKEKMRCVLPMLRWTEEEWTARLRKKSVLRLLEYPTGVGCRPHVDPGLCSALLLGTAGGLEVAVGQNDNGGVEDDGHMPEQKNKCGEDLFLSGGRSFSSATWHSVYSLPSYVSSSSQPPPQGSNAVRDGPNVLLLHNEQLERLTGGRCPAAIHRVADSWEPLKHQECFSSHCRYNLVVELRLPSSCFYTTHTSCAAEGAE